MAVMSEASSPQADCEQPPELSEYEKARAQNIERNNARLRELGLISKAEEKRSNDIAWRRNLYVPDEGDDGDPSGSEESDGEEWVDPRRPHGDAVGPKRKSDKRRASGPPREGSRKSRRLRGVGADGGTIDPPKSAEEVRRERAERVEECREVRLRAARAVAAAGAERAARENPTATYEHCLMRVRTMSERGLGNRVKAIERAAGKHCVVKMAIFKSCLQDEGRWDLAELASEALERLKGLKAPV